MRRPPALLIRSVSQPAPSPAPPPTHQQQGEGQVAQQVEKHGAAVLGVGVGRKVDVLVAAMQTKRNEKMVCVKGRGGAVCCDDAFAAAAPPVCAAALVGARLHNWAGG